MRFLKLPEIVYLQQVWLFNTVGSMRTKQVLVCVCVQNVTSVFVAGGPSPRIPVWFNNREYSVPIFTVFEEGNQTFVRKLQAMDVEVTMVQLPSFKAACLADAWLCTRFASRHNLQVAATPCDAWRVSRIVPTWSSVTVPEESFTQNNAEEKISVNVTLKDLSGPHQLYVPEYGGQIYILIGVSCVAFVGAGTLGLLLSWCIIVWNVQVAAGKDTPWWAYTRHRYTGRPCVTPAHVVCMVLISADVEHGSRTLFRSVNA